MPELSRSPSLPPPILDPQSSLAALESAPTTLSTPITSSSPQLAPTSISFNYTHLDNQQRKPSSSGSNVSEEISEEFQEFLASCLTWAEKTTDDTAAQRTPAPTSIQSSKHGEPYPDSFSESYIVTARQDDEGDGEGAKGWCRLYSKLITDGELSGICTIASLLQTLLIFFKPDFVDSIERHYIGLVDEENREEIIDEAKAKDILNAYFSIFCIDRREVLINILRMEFRFYERERARMQGKANDGGSKKDEGQTKRGQDELEKGVGKKGNDGSGERFGSRGSDRGKGGRVSGMSEKVRILRDTNQVERIRKYPRHFSVDTVKVTYEHMLNQKKAARTSKRADISVESNQNLQKRSTSFEKAARDNIPEASEELGQVFNIGGTTPLREGGFLFHSTPFSNFLTMAKFSLESPTNTICNLSTGPAFLLSNSIALAFSRAVLINPQVRDNFREPIVVLAFKVPRHFFAERRNRNLGGEESLKKEGSLVSRPKVLAKGNETLTKEDFLALEKERDASDEWIVANFDEEKNKGKLSGFVQRNLKPGMRRFLARRAAAPGKTEGVDVVIAPWVDPQQSQAGAELIAGGMSTPGATSLQVACTSRASMKELLRYHYQNYEEDLDGLTVGPC